MCHIETNKLMPKTEAGCSTNTYLKVIGTANIDFIVDDFLSGPNRNADTEASDKLTRQVYYVCIKETTREACDIQYRCE